MPTYEVTDNKTGKVYEIDGPKPPTPEQVSALISAHANQLGRQEAVGGTNWSEELPRMAGQIGGGVVGGIVGGGLSFGNPAGIALGGAAGAGIGRGMSEAIIQANRRFAGQPTEDNSLGGIAQEINTGVMGQLIGDNIGAGLGIAAQGTKGVWNLVKSAHLRGLVNASAGAIKHGTETGWDFVKASPGFQGVQKEVLAASNKAMKAGEYVANRASRYFGKTLEANKDLIVPKVREATDAAFDVLKRSNLVKITTNASGAQTLEYASVPGMRSLKGVIDKINSDAVNTYGQVSVGDMRMRLAELDGIISNEKLRGVRTAALQLRQIVRQKIAATSPQLEKAYAHYSDTMRVVGNTEGLLEPSKIADYHKLGSKAATYQQQAAIDELANSNLPPSKQFISDVKDAAAHTEFTNLTPRKSVSILGGAAALYKPQMLPFVFASIALASPRMSALMYKYPALAGKSMAKLVGTPAGQAATDIAQRFNLRSRLLGAATSEAIDSNQ